MSEPHLPLPEHLKSDEERVILYLGDRWDSKDTKDIKVGDVLRGARVQGGLPRLREMRLVFRGLDLFEILGTDATPDERRGMKVGSDIIHAAREIRARQRDYKGCVIRWLGRAPLLGHLIGFATGFGVVVGLVGGICGIIALALRGCE